MRDVGAASSVQPSSHHTLMLTLALLTTAPGFSRPATSSFCAPGAGWTSEFADEFDGSALDDKVWTVKEGGGNAYCRSATCTAEDVYVEDGALVLRTRRDANNASAYTSGGVDTRRKVSWRHSPAFRICISAMLPGGGGKGQGVWPAHWLMPDSDACDPDQGEMDIMEMVDGDGVHHSTYHWQTCAAVPTPATPEAARERVHLPHGRPSIVRTCAQDLPHFQLLLPERTHGGNRLAQAAR